MSKYGATAMSTGDNMEYVVTGLREMFDEYIRCLEEEKPTGVISLNMEWGSKDPDQLSRGDFVAYEEKIVGMVHGPGNQYSIVELFGQADRRRYSADLKQLENKLLRKLTDSEEDRKLMEKSLNPTNACEYPDHDWDRMVRSLNQYRADYGKHFKIIRRANEMITELTNPLCSQDLMGYPDLPDLQAEMEEVLKYD